MDRYEFVASKDYKKLLIENHVEITDATFASLVFHNKFISTEKIENTLKSLALTTKNKELKKQITLYLQKKQDNLEKFYHNDEGCYFEMCFQDELSGVIYRSYEKAYEDALLEKQPFKISKEYFEDNYDQVGDEVILGTLAFNESGQLQDYGRFQLYRKTVQYPVHSFEEDYIDLPYFFRQGDIVKIVGENQYGIVYSFEDDKDEEDYRKLARRGDYTDFSMTVDLIFENDTYVFDGFNHRHVAPTEIEYAVFENNNDPKKRFLEYMVKTLYHSSFFFGTRDNGRMDQILKRLKKLWEQYPDLRLGQLLLITCGTEDLFAIEDEDLLKLIDNDIFE